MKQVTLLISLLMHTIGCAAPVDKVATPPSPPPEPIKIMSEPPTIAEIDPVTGAVRVLPGKDAKDAIKPLYAYIQQQGRQLQEVGGALEKCQKQRKEWWKWW